MADDSGYTTITHGTPVDMFFFMIKSDIKKLIHTHGHKNCGLMHEELCKKIQKVISEKKKIVFSIMDERGRQKWNNDWNSQKYAFFNKLFEEEGFINVCYPYKKIGNPSLYQLKSRHIQFCKERDIRRAAVVDNPVYSECVKYNSWINTETASLTREFLRNVKDSSVKVVTSYFTTKEKPRGYDPRDTYPKSKLDCKKFNPPSRSHPQGPLTKAPTSGVHLPKTPNVKQESKEKNGRSIPDVDSGGTKINHDVSIPLRPKSPTVDSGLPSSTKIQPDDAANGKHTGVKSKDPVPPIKGDSEKKEAILMHPQVSAGSTPTVQTKPPQRAKTPPGSQTSSSLPKDTNPPPVIQHLPSSTATTSSISSLPTVKDTTSSKIAPTSSSLTIIPDTSLKSGSPSPPDQHSPPLPPATKGQDHVSYSIPGTSSDTHATTHPTKSVPSTTPVNSSLPQPQAPVLIAPPAITTAKEPGTPSTSASTITTTVTATTASPTTVTISTMSTTQNPISSLNQAPGINGSQEPPPLQVVSEPEVTAPNKDPQQTVKQMTTSLSGGDTGGVSVPAQSDTIDNNQHITLSSAPSPKTKDLITEPGVQSANSITTHSAYTPSGKADIQSVKIQETVSQTDTKHNISAVQIRTNKDHDPSTHLVNVDPGKFSRVKPGKNPKNNSVTLKGKNDNPKIIPESIPPLMDIIPTFLYTPFGFLLGRRRKRKKQDLRRIFEIPEKPAYESPNIALHEWEDHNLVGQTKEKDVYIKLLKINRYKQEMQKRKKKNKKTLIEVHMEVFEESKNSEWELHKGDFLEICLHGFINEESDTYSKLSNSELTVNNTNKHKTIEDIQKQDILWNNWIENHRNILEQWKEKEWFHILKNKWRNEEQKYKEKNDKLRENILNEQETHSIVSQKDIWKQWISKQATLIDMFNKEDWFKSMVYVQNKEKNNYHINEYNNISVISKTELKNEKMNHEQGRSKNIIQKLMVQIHMMVLEECIKEDFIKHKELCIDNFIEDIHNQNNYDEKRNITQCDTDDFDVLEFQEIQTSRNK
ncbi:STP1 protein [Plasmodium ovale]|uniref:STP1 protein n=1 Tax=Plasmodium ovale TaxID=36330 RepID=A0A1D3JCR6_PLAOA|nr:STP1 protein [Plasmodium ovale]